MPIQNKDLGKYNRPDIFITETDNSIIELPIQDVLINLVPGFSKKGPVNNPTYVDNTNDFVAIFGDIDKGLERNESYFHRTCLKMLESGPIYALNLLMTDDTRDNASWKSMSCATEYANSTTSQIPYSRIFNRQDFWKRDSESFLDYINDPTIDTNRLLHLTNLGDKINTTFIYKSSITGFDITLEDWYGGTTKVPTYLNPKDLVSDYLVSVLIIDGDWTNYSVLAADQTWGTYFDETGLDKTKIQAFVDETNVTTLGYYNTSLIPYFKDINGRDMYIKSLINNDTDKTGLFCAYGEDLLLDSEFPNGKVDLIGNSLVDAGTTTIDFLSYNDSIIETLTYTTQNLDDYGNSFGNYDADMSSVFVDTRIGSKTNHYIHGCSMGLTATTLVELTGVKDDAGKSWFYMDPSVIPGIYHDLLATNDVVYFSATYDVINANTLYYVEDVTDSGRQFSISTTEGGAPINISATTTLTSYVQKAEINLSNNLASIFNLDGTGYTFDTGNTVAFLEPLEFTGEPTGTTTMNLERYDVIYLSKGNLAQMNILKGTQETTGAALPNWITTVDDYDDYVVLGYVHLSMTSGGTPATAATNIVLNADYTQFMLDTDDFSRWGNIVASSGSTATTNYIRLSFGATSGSSADYSNDYNKIIYRNAYNEIESNLDDGKGVIIQKTFGEKFYITTDNFSSVDPTSSTDGYIKIDVGASDPENYYSGAFSWLLYFLDNEFIMNDTSTDRMITSTQTVTNLVGSGQTTNAGVIGKYSNIYLDYYNGILSNGDFAYVDNTVNPLNKIYVKAWLQNTDILYVDYTNEDQTSPIAIEDFSTDYESNLYIYSNNSNYKQTIELGEDPDTSKLPDNLYTIKVDKTRYSEVAKGGYLEAYYDSDDLETGEEAKKLTRIVTVTIDTVDTDLKVITCDSPILITQYSKIVTGISYITHAYSTIEDYVSTYKGVALIPFTVSSESLPNKTETRQSSILDLIDPETNLGKGLINKNKISWRYLVDAFGLGLTAASKQQYTDLCGAKLNSFAFVNAPSVKTLKKSTNPYFINDDITLNTDYLKAGGDESRNPSFLYSFSTGVGRSTVGYFFPYVTIDDDGAPKDVPPSSYVATTYMNKFLTTQSSIEPWTIAAGISNGRILNIADVEMDFSDDDLSNLYQMGLNPIVKKKDNGFCINSESTAQVFPYSSLSIIHSREVLIELENALYDMLLKYQWKFNTQEIRAEIKYRSDKICQNFKERYGLYDYDNIIDETNNTNYIIDLQMGVLDTYIEIIKGMGIIVNNITILKKGSIQSGGFR